jgi:CheY-like chemotaxis protein/anti-sigma regulatory factor (Ser/Thr protein kinase)
MEQARLLVVDDDPTIRAMLTEFLSEHYAVTAASSGNEALGILEKSTFDLTLSDINMPGINGFELIRQIRAKWPKTKVALITDYNVDTYIKMALDENITNIIVKNAPFQIEELYRTVDNLLTGRRVFGMENYLAENTPIDRCRICSSEEIEAVREKLIAMVETTNLFASRAHTIRMIFEEIASNALYHAYGYKKFERVELKPDQVVEVCFGKDEQKLGFSVSDHSGRLTKEIVLRKILRAMSQDGVLDTDGRGLFLTRSFSDRFIINIKPKEKTEIIVLNHFDSSDEINKPLYINEF